MNARSGADGAMGGTRRDMRRAIRRLSILECVVLGLAMAIAAAGGWISAWLLKQGLGLPFRLTWIASSVLLFAVPGALHFRANGKNTSTNRARSGNGSEAGTEHGRTTTDGTNG